jgi:dUTP pyrophosphatase
MKVEIKILDARLHNPELAPSYATAGAAAIDMRAMAVIGSDGVPLAMFDPLVVRAGEVVKIGTGIAMHLGSIHDDEGPLSDDGMVYGVMLLPRSGLGSKKIRLANTVGLVDADYQGEFILALENAGSSAFVINPTDRLAQAMIVPVMRPTFQVVDEFSAATSRGAGGFGSTGTK